MKIVMKIAENDVILTPEQLEVIVNIVAAAERIDQKWMGTASVYQYLLRPVEYNNISTYCMDDTKYEAMKLITKLHDAEAANK